MKILNFCYNSVEWIELSQDTGQRWTFMETVWVPLNLTSPQTTGLNVRTLPLEVIQLVLENDFSSQSALCKQLMQRH